MRKLLVGSLWFMVISLGFFVPPVLAVSTGVQLPSAGPLDRLQNSNQNFEWVKFQYQWGSGQPYMEWVEAARAQGKKVLLSVAPKKPDNLPPTEGTYQQFGQFMKELAIDLGDKVDAYEIWNEPNIIDEWTNVGLGPTDPAEYTKLLASGAAGVKAGNPNAKVISAGLATNAPNELQFLYDYASTADLSNVDCIGAHLDIVDNIPPDSDDDRGFQRVKHYLVYGKPVCITELGWNRSRAGIDRQTQAQYIAQAFEIAPSLGNIDLMVVWNFGFSKENNDPDFPNWDIEGSDINLPPGEQASPIEPPSSTPSGSQTAKRSEQALDSLNLGLLPKEAIKDKPEDQSLWNQIASALAQLFSNPLKAFARAENLQQSSIPLEIETKAGSPPNQLDEFLGGSKGFFGVSLPEDVQNTSWTEAEKSYEQANFPEGVRPITGQ